MSMKNNVNVSLEDEIKKSDFSEEIKNEALKVLNEVAEGSSDDKIKNNIQDDIYELIAKENMNEGEEQ